MKSFLEKLRENIQNNPELTVLRSAHCPAGLTYRQLDEYSGRVCRYLTDRHIGKEDFVMVLMPREVSAYVSVIGIWRSGAAMTLLEENYSPERVDYIKKDIGCKLVITQDVYNEMMTYEPCIRWAVPDEHDACYAAYTSGSTGHPKGIIHEFGKLDMFDYDYHSELKDTGKGDSFAIVTPLNFGPSIRNAVTSLMYGKCLHVIPSDTVKNPKQLIQYFTAHRITETSVTCSFARNCHFSTPYLKNIFVHSEPCSDVYFEGPHIINLYTLSEVVFPIFTCWLDAPYDCALLGYANETVKVRIINEQGTETKPYEIGEITVEDPYTRGYVNLPEKTAEVFRNGIFYTGDFAYCDEKGKCYLCGRKDDMIKINGNRIEPAEIEAVVKKILSVRNAVSKGFVTEKRSFVAMYLLRGELAEKGLLDANGNLIYTPSEMTRKIANLLPSYMIPAYYTVMESFPTNMNNKISRKDFPEPVVSDYIRVYEEPKNEKEAYFCRLFETVLEVDKVGVYDDFYEIGGDSLSAMQLVALCADYNVSITDIYNAKTPRKLAETIRDDTCEDRLRLSNRNALSKPQPVLPESEMLFAVQKQYPTESAFNMKKLWMMQSNVDIHRFKNAVDRVLRHHPIFSTVLSRINATTYMNYRPECLKETEIVSITEAALDELIRKVVNPFTPEGNVLYTSSVFVTENHTYYYLEIHHGITDGASIKNMIEEISASYHNPDAELPTDYLYLIAENTAELSAVIAKRITAVAEQYRFADYTRKTDNTVKQDFTSDSFLYGDCEGLIPCNRKQIENTPYYQKYGGNVFFMVCYLKTIARYNGQSKAFSFWDFNGRSSKLKQSAHGLLCQTFPVVCNSDLFSCETDLFDSIRTLVNYQTASDFDWYGMMERMGNFENSPNFIYQKDIVDFNFRNDIFEKYIWIKRFGVIFELQMIDNAHEPRFRYILKYDRSRYAEESVKRFCQLFEDTVIGMIRQ